METEKIFNRQLGLFPPDKIDIKNILLIGCGSVGSAVGMGLAKCGARSFRLVDGDIIEKHNLPNQFFARSAVDKHKVDSLEEEIERFAPTFPLIETVKEFFTEDNAEELLDGVDIIVLSVDSLKVRAEIFELVLKYSNAKLLVDGRTAKNLATIYTVNLEDQKEIEWYRSTLTGRVIEAPCTERSVMYNVLVVSGLMCAQIRNVLMGVEEHKFEIVIDLEHMLLI
jgi:molybdopterin/thiamine biosynthesis adenylyltransferase